MSQRKYLPEIKPHFNPFLADPQISFHGYNKNKFVNPGNNEIYQSGHYSTSGYSTAYRNESKNVALANPVSRPKAVIGTNQKNLLGEYIGAGYYVVEVEDFEVKAGEGFPTSGLSANLTTSKDFNSSGDYISGTGLSFFGNTFTFLLRIEGYFVGNLKIIIPKTNFYYIQADTYYNSNEKINWNTIFEINGDGTKKVSEYTFTYTLPVGSYPKISINSINDFSLPPVSISLTHMEAQEDHNKIIVPATLPSGWIRNENSQNDYLIDRRNSYSFSTDFLAGKQRDSAISDVSACEISSIWTQARPNRIKPVVSYGQFLASPTLRYFATEERTDIGGDADVYYHYGQAVTYRDGQGNIRFGQQKNMPPTFLRGPGCQMGENNSGSYFNTYWLGGPTKIRVWAYAMSEHREEESVRVEVHSGDDWTPVGDIGSVTSANTIAKKPGSGAVYGEIGMPGAGGKNGKLKWFRLVPKIKNIDDEWVTADGIVFFWYVYQEPTPLPYDIVAADGTIVPGGRYEEHNLFVEYCRTEDGKKRRRFYKQPPSAFAQNAEFFYVDKILANSDSVTVDAGSSSIAGSAFHTNVQFKMPSQEEEYQVVEMRSPVEQFPGYNSRLTNYEFVLGRLSTRKTVSKKGLPFWGNNVLSGSTHTIEIQTATPTDLPLGTKKLLSQGYLINQNPEYLFSTSVNISGSYLVEVFDDGIDGIYRNDFVLSVSPTDKLAYQNKILDTRSGAVMWGTFTREISEWTDISTSNSLHIIRNGTGNCLGKNGYLMKPRKVFSRTTPILSDFDLEFIHPKDFITVGTRIITNSAQKTVAQYLGDLSWNFYKWDEVPILSTTISQPGASKIYIRVGHAAWAAPIAGSLRIKITQLPD